MDFLTLIQYFLAGVMLFGGLWTTLILLRFNRQVRDTQRVDRSITKKTVLKIIISCVLTGLSFGFLASTFTYEAEEPLKTLPFGEWLGYTILGTLFCTIAWTFLALIGFGLRLVLYLRVYYPNRDKVKE